MKARIFVKRGDDHFKIGDLNYSAQDGSIYLSIPRRLQGGGRRGITKLDFAAPGSPFSISLGDDSPDLQEIVEFDHFSIHGSGVEHTVLQGNLHRGRSQGIPLRGLATGRHLWSIVVPDIHNETPQSATRLRDLKLDYPVGMNAGVIDIFAMPAGVDFSLNFELLNESDRATIHNFGQGVWDVPSYRVFVMFRSADSHEGSPEATFKVSLSDGFIPLITKISPTKVEGIVAVLGTEAVTVPFDPNRPLASIRVELVPEEFVSEDPAS